MSLHGPLGECKSCGKVYHHIPGQRHVCAPRHDAVNHPAHYTGHPSGVECIQITEHMNFCRGNAVKYIWRAGEKGNEVEDLRKARWYLDREIERLERTEKGAQTHA